MEDILERYPAFRLVIPYILGIVASGVVLRLPTFFLSGLCIMAGLVILCCFLAVWGRGGVTTGHVFGVVLTLLMAVSGFTLSQDRLRKTLAVWPEEKMLYQGMLRDYPVEKANSVLLQLSVPYGGSRHTLFLYVPKDSTAFALIPGQSVAFYGAPQSVTEQEPGYARYLTVHGVSATLWVPASGWRVTGAEGRLTLGTISAVISHRLMQHYEKMGLSPQALSLVTAVVLGDRSLVDEQMRQDFSVSGASHLLAVSGLHVGILYSVLCFLFPAFMNIGRRVVYRELIIMAALWCYAYIIGMPLSIVRCLVMLTFIAVSRCMGRENSSLNSLALAALFILSVNPLGLYDIGFQLSFCAVWAILVLQPLFSNLINADKPVMGYFAEIITVSIAAQFGTAPIAACCFGTFPTYFLLTNLIAIPVMFLIVSIGMLLLVVPAGGMGLLSGLLNVVVSLLAQVTRFIASLPGASLPMHIDGVWQVVGIYVIIVLLYIYVTRKKPRVLILLLLLFSVQSIAGLIKICNFAN